LLVVILPVFIFIKNGSRFHESVDASEQFSCKSKSLLIRVATRVEKTPIKLSADWIIKNHYLGNFPSAIECSRNFPKRGISWRNRSRHEIKNNVPKVFGSIKSEDCILLFGAVFRCRRVTPSAIRSGETRQLPRNHRRYA
jgi:hypothetical protein